MDETFWDRAYKKYAANVIGILILKILCESQVH